jgi:glycosyltransferase 2 family protein
MVNRKELAELVKHISWPYLIGYFVLNWLDRFVMAYKWKILLDSKKISCSLKKTIIVYLKGTFWGNLFPTSLGGDAIRAYELAKNTKTGVDVISSIIMERFLGFLSSALMAILAIPFLFFFVSSFPRNLLLLLVGVIFLGVFFLVLIMREEGTGVVKKLLAKLSWADKITQITASFVLYRDHPRALGKFFILSFGEQLMPILTIYFLARTLGLQVSFFYLALIIPLAQFFARIPVSLSGFGIQEGLFISFFPFVGITTTASFALGFASNLGNILSGLPGAYFYLIAPSVEKAKLEER